MDVSTLTIGQAQQLLADAEKLKGILGGAPADPPTTSGHGWQVGKCYFIRTVTHHLLGKLEAVTDQELWLSSMSWIADDGRFNECLAKGTANEVEPAPEGTHAVGRGSIIDAYLWPHALWRTVK